MALTLLDRRGPYEAWHFLTSTPEPDLELPEPRSDWYTAHARVLVYCRDFERAAHWLERAREACPASPWVAVAGVALLARQDRRQDAEREVRRVLADHPSYVPAVHWLCELLLQLDRGAEARALLQESLAVLEYGHFALRLAKLQIGDGALDDAEALQPSA